MTWWDIPKMWEGGDCWILGGGSSLPHQFGVPNSIIEKVYSQELPLSTYSDFLEPLHDRNVIAVNASFLLGNWTSVLYFSDRGFLRNYLPQILRYPNLKVTSLNDIDAKLRGVIGNVKRVKRDNRPGLCPNQNMLCWNFNSGMGAIDLAVHFGVKKIYLLGFDMKITDGQSHWHGKMPCYDKVQSPNVYTRFLRRAPIVAEHCANAGVEVINVNPDSAMDEFKKESLTNVL